MPAPYNWKQRFVLALLPPIGAVLIRLLCSTLRYEDVGSSDAHESSNPETRVYAIWHRSLLCVAHRFRERRIAILISPSFDGELIARTICRVGYNPVRGSSSRGGAGGLLGMRRALDREDSDRCNYAALTTDGPRGPIYAAKPGVVKLAQQLGGGVGIFYAAPDRAWQLRSWDRFLIPKPFSTVVIGWQVPIPVLKDADENTLETARLAVEQALNRARHSVEERINQRRANAKSGQA